MKFSDVLVALFSGVWELFSLKWPGFNFTIGSVFLAVLLSSTFFALAVRLIGGHLPPIGQFFRNSNNQHISISNDRRNDRK